MVLEQSKWRMPFGSSFAMQEIDWETPVGQSFPLKIVIKQLATDDHVRLQLTDVRRNSLVVVVHAQAELDAGFTKHHNRDMSCRLANSLLCCVILLVSGILRQPVMQSASQVDSPATYSDIVAPGASWINRLPGAKGELFRGFGAAASFYDPCVRPTLGFLLASIDGAREHHLSLRTLQAEHICLQV